MTGMGDVYAAPVVHTRVLCGWLPCSRRRRAVPRTSRLNTVSTGELFAHYACPRRENVQTQRALLCARQQRTRAALRLIRCKMYSVELQRIASRSLAAPQRIGARVRAPRSCLLGGTLAL